VSVGLKPWPWPSAAGAFSVPNIARTQIIANSVGFFGYLAFFEQPAKCEVAHTIFPFSPSKVRHGDIYLAPGGDTGHQNQNQLGSHMSSGWFLR
jgi:hypothetical protein